MRTTLIKKTPILIYSIAIAILTFFIIYNANFTLGDQAQYLRTTAIGKILSPNTFVAPDLGRFFPLGVADYNILLLFIDKPSATAHFTINGICFIATAILMFNLCMSILKEKSLLNYSIAGITSLFLLARVYSVFLDLIFPERLMTLMIIALIYSSWRFWQTDNTCYLIGAIISAIYVIYCKEPMFGTLLIFSGFILIFGKDLSTRRRIFLWSLVVNSIIYITLYVALVYSNTELMYDGSHGETNVWNTYYHMTISQKILFFALPLLLYRIYIFIKKSEREHMFFDALLLCSFAYFGACLLLGLNFTYYYFPAICLMTPAILYFMVLYFKKTWTLITLSLLCIFYVTKLPKTIRGDQEFRLTCKQKVEELVTYYKTGYEIVWDNCNDLEGYERNLYDWRKESLLVYFSYLIGNNQYNFSDKNHQSKYIILSQSQEGNQWYFGLSLTFH